MHKHQGFTFIEVMFALMIIAMVMVPIWGLQGNVLTSIAQFRDRLARIWFAQQTLHQARRAQAPDATQFTLNTQEQIPNSTITYELKPVPKNSAVGTQHRLFSEKVVAQGTDKRNKETIISFVYKPEQNI